MADLNDLTTNVNIWNDDKSKSVTVTTDGSKERLDVDANVSGGVIIAQKNPYFDYSDLTNGVDYSVKSVTAKGTIDFIQILCKNASYEVAIKIDGTERIRISQSDLGTIGLLSSNSTNIPIYAASASKIFSFLPPSPDGFATSFEVIVQATSAGNSIDGWFIHWNEE
jgi:hypothetical protein